MRSKKTKRIVAAVLAVVLLAGGGTGAFFLVRHSGKAVNVFSVSEIGQTDMWMDNPQYDGAVRAENLQSVYLSDTQQLKEVFVHEGDAVKKGDKLAAFDTTLSDLELERQKIEVQKLELNLSNLQSALRRINSMTPYVPPTPAPAPAPEELDPVALPKRLSGNGTEAKPYVYLWNETCQYDDAFIAQILPLKEADTAPAGEETTAAAEEAEEVDAPVYEASVSTVVFQVREYDNPKGELIYTWGMTFTRKPDGGYFFTVFQPDDSFAGNDTQEIAELPEIDPEGGYTAAEIARMRSETQQDIRDTETKLKVERLKLKKLELEISTGVVTAVAPGRTTITVKTFNGHKACFAAAIYTQTTDVEVEVNGLMTYDREVVKVFEDRIREANRKMIETNSDVTAIDLPSQRGEDLAGDTLYNLQGMRIANPVAGLNILHRADGSSVKFMYR